MRAVRLPPAEAMRPEPPARHAITLARTRAASPARSAAGKDDSAKPAAPACAHGALGARCRLRRRHSDRRDVLARRDRSASRRAVQRRAAPGLHGRVRRAAIRSGTARTRQPAGRAGGRAGAHGAGAPSRRSPDASAVITGTRRTARACSASSTHRCRPFHCLPMDSCSRRSLPRSSA